MEMISVTEAAKKRGVTRARIIFYINNGRLPATKIGNQYAIKAADLAKLKTGKAGRPKKIGEATNFVRRGVKKSG